MNTVWKIILNKIDNFKLEKGLTSFVNPYSMLILKEYPQIAEHIDFWHVDGISLVNRINASLNMNIRRYSFDETSVAPIVFQYAKDHKLSIAIVGTKQEYLEAAVSNIEKNHEIKVSYYRDGYFDSAESREHCIQTIIDRNIELVICGMGTPFQEMFLIDLKKRGWNGYGFTCGGYLHQIAKKESYYPAIFDKLNIRWMYRIIDEPKLFKRYLIDYPNFFIEFKSFLKKYN